MFQTRLQVRHGLYLVFLLFTGCGDGAFPELNGLNPFLRSQWRQDRQYGPTFDEQLDELARLESSATRLSPEEQLKWTRSLTEIIRDDRSPLFRARSARALAALPTPAAVEGLRIATADQETQVRVAACEAWGRRGGPESIAALAKLVESDTSVDVRMAATRELGKFSEPQAVQALGMALNDKDPALQHRAIDSLRTATGQDYPNDVAVWREYVRGGNPQVAPPSLVERLRDVF